MKRFNIVIPEKDGGVEIHAMKKWLRANLQQVPSGMDVSSSNSWHLRNGLRRSGWSVQDTDSEVRLIAPGADTQEIFGVEE